MDSPREEWKYFFNTIPPGDAAMESPGYATLVEQRASESLLQMDASLVGRDVVFIFRLPCGIRLSSKCRVQGVHEERRRSLAGEMQLFVELARTDGTTCTVGLSHWHYWPEDEEEDDMTGLYWFVHAQ